MAEDLNALLQANRSSSVLQGIANPAQVNPLAAITAGNQAAQSEFQTRDWQAKQAVGKAYQGAIDPNGEFDSNKFRTLLSQSGPAALQAGAALLNTQNISSDELNQQKIKLDLYNSSLGSLMAMGNNVTHADVVSRIQSLMAHKTMTLPEAQRIMSTIPEGQAELAAWVKQHALTVADASTRFNQTIGTRQTFTTPGATYNAPVPPPGMGQPTVAVPHGPGPGETQAGGIWVDAKGAEVPEGTPGAVWQEGVRPKTQMPQFQQGGPPTLLPGSGPSITPPPPVPPGTIYNVPGRGNQIAPIFDPMTGQRLTPTTTPPPMPPGARPDGPGRRSALEGGVPVASADQSMVLQTGAPGAPSPMAASNVADIEAGMAQARGGPRPPGTQTAADTRSSFIPTAPPQGQQANMDADVKAYTEDRAAYQSVITRAQNLAHAYEALSQLKSNTGKGAAGLQALRSYAGTLGIASTATMKEQELVEIINKYTTRAMVDAAGGSTTDMGRHLAESSNPGTTLGNAANFRLMQNDLATVLQKSAAYQEYLAKHPNSQGGGYTDLRNEIAKTDPRGFIWNTFPEDEQAKILADVKDDPKADAALHKAIGMARRLNVQVPGAALRPPPPDRRSMLMPPTTPPANPLMMAG